MKPEKNTTNKPASQQKATTPKDNKAGKKKVVPQTGTDSSETDTGGSMSEGNLSNSRHGRERTRSLHDKTTIMGSDNDGQSN